MCLIPFFFRENRLEHMRALRATTLASTASATSDSSHIQEKHHYICFLGIYRQGYIHYSISTLGEVVTLPIEAYQRDFLAYAFYEIFFKSLYISAFLIQVLISKEESLLHTYNIVKTLSARTPTSLLLSSE